MSLKDYRFTEWVAADVAKTWFCSYATVVVVDELHYTLLSSFYPARMILLNDDE